MNGHISHLRQRRPVKIVRSWCFGVCYVDNNSVKVLVKMVVWRLLPVRVARAGVWFARVVSASLSHLVCNCRVFVKHKSSSITGAKVLMWRWLLMARIEEDNTKTLDKGKARFKLNWQISFGDKLNSVTKGFSCVILSLYVIQFLFDWQWLLPPVAVELHSGRKF